MNLGESIIAFIATMIFFLIPILGIYWVYRLADRTEAKRDKMLRGKFGEDLKIYRSFPLPADKEEIVQGGLFFIIQHFRELLVSDGWLFIQPTFRGIRKLTMFEDRNRAVLSLFAQTFDSYSPTFVIRNRQNKSLVSRYFQTQIKNGKMVRSELDFDNDQVLYAERDKHIQTLQIMSPELLLVLKNAPAKADIIIKKNQLYYIMSGEKPAEKVLNDILVHSQTVVRELTDNVTRWGRSAANTEEYERIKNTELSVTLGELYQRGELY